MSSMKAANYRFSINLCLALIIKVLVLCALTFAFTSVAQAASGSQSVNDSLGPIWGSSMASMFTGRARADGPTNVNPGETFDVDLYAGCVGDDYSPRPDIVARFDGSNSPRYEDANCQLGTMQLVETRSVTAPMTPGSVDIPFVVVVYCTDCMQPAATITQFTYTVDVPNNPPNTPSISGPASGDTGVGYSFVFTATDAGDQLRYQVDWDDNGTVDQTLPASGYVSSGVGRTANRSWGSPGTYTFQVRAQDDEAAVSGWRDHTITITTPPPPNAAPGTPTVSGPTTGDTGVTYSFNLMAHDPDAGDQIRYGIDWDNNSTIDEWLPGGYIVTGTGKTASYSWGSPGTYTFRVMAQDDDGANSGSRYHTITISSAPPPPPPNQPPDTPTITGTTTGFPATSYDFQLNATDPDVEQVRFQIDWDNNGTFDQTTGYVNSGTNLTVSRSWPMTGARTFNVRAQDAVGDVSASVAHTITIVAPPPVNAPPAQPTITGPNTSDTGTSNTFTLNSTDPDGDQIRYHIDRNNDGSPDLIQPASGYVNSGSNQLYTWSWGVPGTYTFKVYAEDDNGAQSPWRSHTVTVTAPPPPPVCPVGTWQVVGELSCATDGACAMGTCSYDTTPPWTNTGGGLHPVDSCCSTLGAVSSPTCSGEGEYWTMECQGAPPPPPPPTYVSLTINGSEGPLSVSVGDPLDLKWTASGVSSCTAFGAGWNGPKALNDNETINATVSSNYILDCDGITDQVTINIGNSAPDSPTVTPNGGNTNYVGDSQQFSVLADDPDGDDIYYQVDWDSNGTVDATTATVPANTSRNISYTWSSIGAKSFRVRTVDAIGNTSSWKNENITIDPVPIAPPVTVVEVSINGGSWTTTNPTISEGDTVAIRWDGGAEPTTTCAGTNVTTGSARSGQTSVTAPTPGNSTTYTVTCSNGSGSDDDSIIVSKLNLTDLTISIGSYTVSTDGDPLAYDPATGNYDSVIVNVSVQNGGTAITNSFEVDVGIDRSGSSGPFTDTQTFTIPAMATGTASTVQAVFLDVPFARAHVEAVADVNNTVPESNEADNTDVRLIAENPPPVDMTLIIDPEELVRGGSNAELEWDTYAYFPLTCSISGPGLTTVNFDPNVSGTTFGSPATAGPINAKSEYVLTCEESITGTIYEDRVSVGTTGTVQEI